MFCLSILCGVGQVACGQKGPPLAPIVYLPRPVTELAVKRVEGDVVLQFTVPSANTDGSSPADLERVEVWAHTGPLPAPTDFLKYGTLVQSIEIKQPPPPVKEEEKKEERRAEGKETQAGATDAAAPEPATPKPAVEAAKPAADAPKPAVEAAKPAADAPKPAAAVAADPEPAPPKPVAESPANVEPVTPKQPVEEAAKPEPLTPKQAAEAALKAGSPVEQGWAISVRETLTQAHNEIGPMPPARAIVPVAGAPQIETLETPGTINFTLPPARFYTVVAVSESRGRRGPYAGPIRVPLVSPLPSPGPVATTYTPDAIVLTWPAHPEDSVVPVAAVPTKAPGAEQTVAATPTPGPSAGVPAPVTPVVSPAAELSAIEDPNQETPGTHEIYAAIETDGTVDAPLAAAAAAPVSRPQPPPTPRFGYNVYEVAPVAPLAPLAPRAPVAPEVPLNAALLTTPAFKDTRVEFGIERCYVVRRVEMASGVPIESAPSPVACVTLVDTFPPPPPASLAHVASGTEVSLIWETSTAADLAGYLVLRGEAPGDKLAPLTAAPISDASYVDTSVRRNRTYVYEVVAVDKSGNQSAPSNRVEETIR